MHPHTQQLLVQLLAQEGILAAKGCGAMGADVIVAFVATERLLGMVQSLSSQGHRVLGTSQSLYAGAGFFQHDELFRSKVY